MVIGEGTRRRLRRVIVVGWVAMSLSAIVAGYHGTSPVLAWQMFPEASRWQATIVRIDAGGERVDVAHPFPGGYRWVDLVGAAGFGSPSVEQAASYGVAATLAMLEHALGWVAANTPDDHETVRLEAVVTYWRNADAPQTVVLRSPPREPSG